MSTLGEKSVGENGCVARPRVTSCQVSRLACGSSKRAGVATSTSARTRCGCASAKSIATAPPSARPTSTNGPQRQRVGERRREAHVRVEIGQALGAAGAPVPGQIERQRRVAAASKCASCLCQVCALEPAPCRNSSSSPRSSGGVDVGQRRRAGVEVVDRDAVDRDVLGEHAECCALHTAPPPLSTRATQRLWRPRAARHASDGDRLTPPIRSAIARTPRQSGQAAVRGPEGRAHRRRRGTKAAMDRVRIGLIGAGLIGGDALGGAAHDRRCACRSRSS